MKILIDCQALQTASSSRGIGRYVRGVIKGLTQLNENKFELILLVDGSRSVTAQEIYQEYKSYNVKFLYWYSATLSSLPAWGANNAEFNSDLLYEAAVINSHSDILLIGSVFEGANETFCLPIEKLVGKIKLATVCYDFIPFQELNNLSIEEKYWYGRCLNRLNLCSVLLCISEYTKSIANLVFPDIPAVNVSGGVDEDVFNCRRTNNIGANDSDEKFINEIGIDRPFFLYAGGGDSRKNVDFLFHTFVKLCTNELKDFQLVLVMGSHLPAADKFSGLVSSLGLQSRIKVLRYITNDQLVCLYRNCFLFVFPSLAEGLGFSVLEAMSCGAPVISSNSTSLPEVHGFSEGEFSPDNSDELSNLLVKVTQDSQFYKELKQHGQEHVRLFTWKNTASLIFSALEHLDSKNIQIVEDHIGVKDIVERAKIRPQTEIEYEALAQAIASQFYRRIYIDITETIKQKRVTGIQRVVLKILKYIEKLLPENWEAVFVVLKEGTFYLYERESDNWVSRGLINPKPSDVFLCLDLNIGLSTAKDFFMRLKNKGVKVVSVVYDLVYELHPEVVGCDAALLQEWLQYVTTISDRVLCISKSVKNELEEWARRHKGMLKGDLDYFYLCCDILTNTHDLVKSKTQDGRFCFVCISTVEPRKGYDLVLDAFEVLFDSYDIELHIVGKKGWKVEDLCKRIEHSKHFNKKLFWHSHASDQELVQILSSSDAYINASIYEGFGLPIVEATQFRLPLFLRNIHVFKELAGIHARYFNTAQDLVELVKTFIKSPQSFVPMPLNNIITWEESVRQLIRKIPIG